MRDASRTLVIEHPVDAIRSARVWHCKYRTLAPLASCAHLRTLVVGTYPDDNLRILESFPELRYLRILHMPKITNLDSISSLRRLDTLSLATAVEWDRRKRVQTVRSLEPIAALPSLRHLELFGIVDHTGSLRSLHGIPALKSARVSGYSDNDLRAFYAATHAVDEFNPSPDLGG